MNDQTETANAAEPKLCKMGCGFFGSNATGDCCSKCFNALRQKEGGSLANSQQPILAATPTPQPSAVAPVLSSVQPDAPYEAPANAEPAKKKKKKKTSYKNMLAGMMEGSGTRDVEKEKETIARVTGGGQFSKIDKI
eukprot:CCRYP_002861-RA/>CCRYP_002861-RA protein AED:0.07 eAED:0.07 QI:261/1/1/1/1/1/2/337/136